MAEAQSLPQPQPRQFAQYLQYLHNAADQIALSENPPTFTNDQMLRENDRMLRENTRSIAALQEAVRALNTTLQTNMTALNATMTREFARLNTKLDSTENNARARLDNSRVTTRNQALTIIRTTDNTEPHGFPATLAQLSSMTAENLNPLLDAYRLQRDGPIDVRRRRFRTFIGKPDDY